MGAGDIQRVKREECKSTKHDHVFSKWEILIGPSDWEAYSLGKDGIERYRTHNLPISCSCPGLYELGIATIPTDVGHKVRALDPNCIIVVYLGQAENVRTRLQHYGRAGSHLDYGKSILLNEYKSPCLERGPGLFREIFSRGFPIVFRWVPMKNKKEAEKTEAQLLGFFDYAWNKGGNGTRRREDILLKLDGIASGTSRFYLLPKLPHWYWRVFSERHEGFRIDASMPSKDTEIISDLKHNLAWRVFKFSKNRPQVIPGNGEGNDDFTICGVSLGDGSVCRRMPVEGRERCGEHKGKRINGSISRSVITKEGIANGTSGLCPLVKGGVNEDYNICGSSLGDGSVCRSKPIEGRKRCGEHRGRRVSGSISRSLVPGEEMAKVRSGDCILVKGLTNDDNTVCGVLVADGSTCRSRPIKGRKRCDEHRGMRINVSFSRIVNEGKSGVCGVSLEDGSICMEFPVHGRKRCEFHIGMRVTF